MKNCIFSALLAASMLTSCAAPTPAPAVVPPTTPSPQVLSESEISLTDDQERQVRNIISRNLRDPASAQFRSWRTERRVLDNGNTVLSACGEINAKNGFGAYVGFLPFNVTLINGRESMSAIYDPNEFVTSWVIQISCKGN